MNIKIVLFIYTLHVITKCEAATCNSAPPTIFNGYRSYSTSSVTYYCNTGYYGSGTQTYSCINYVWGDDYWPTISYTCTIRNCGTPPTLSYGYRSYSSTTYGSTVTYNCNTGYFGTGTNSISCQSSGAWSSLGYSCTIADCGTPPTISNGARSYSSTTYGSTVTYSCNTGYSGSGTNTITCQSSGTWSTVVFVCNIKDCGTPPTLSNGVRVFSTTTYLSTVTYSCNNGYTGSGSSSIACQSDGTWSTFSYICTLDSTSTSVTSTISTSTSMTVSSQSSVGTSTSIASSSQTSVGGSTTTQQNKEGDNGSDGQHRAMTKFAIGCCAVFVCLLNYFD